MGSILECLTRLDTRLGHAIEGHADAHPHVWTLASVALGVTLITLSALGCL